MMTEVIAQLEANAMPPLKLVQGAAKLAALQANPPKHLQPAAFVFPVGDRAGQNEVSTGVSQKLLERVGVSIVLGDLSDRRGEGAAETIETVKAAVRAALIGWQPTAAHTAITLAQGQLAQIEDGVLWWLDEYEAQTWLRAV